MKIILSIGLLLFVWNAYSQINEKLQFDLYEKYKGKIVFSNNKISFNELDEKNLKSSFTINDEIFGQIVLKQPLAECYKENSYEYDFKNLKYAYNYSMRLFVDGVFKEQWLYEFAPENFKYTVHKELVISSSDPIHKRTNSEFVYTWVDLVTLLNPGMHTFRFEVVPMNIDIVGNDLPILASGSFTMNIEEKSIEQFKMEKTPDLPRATFSSKSIEKELLEASSDVYAEAIPLQAIITDRKGSWMYSRDINDFIESRHIIASVVYKYVSSGECWVKTGMYSQEYKGYDDYGTMTYFKETEGYYDYRVPCWKVDKIK